jgi:uncharacterized coiled-coil DUF342 family protein
MATLTKISSSRMGPPRFGNRPHNIDTSVKTYQLTPEELAQLRAGKSVDEILKEREEMKNKIDLTVEEYVEMRKQGMSYAEIAKAKGITRPQLHSWKQYRKKEIEEFEKKLLAEQSETADEQEQETSTQEVVTKVNDQQQEAEDDNGMEWLKREAIHAHKLLMEKEQECEQLKQEVEHWKEMFETVMSDKERLQKENLLLENQIQRLKEANDELTAKNERYFADLMRLEQEVKGLRLYALQKLHIDVYGA